VFRRLDVKNIGRGWQEIYLPNPSLVIGCQYGVLPLDSEDDDFVDFLVFGGIEANDPHSPLSRTMLFHTNLHHFSHSSFTPVAPLYPPKNIE